MGALPAGRHFFRGTDGYEHARRGTVWHQRVPERYPEVIVRAVDAADVIAGIRYAKANGHKVSIVSGGHSFAASHLRDGAVLLDVSRLDHATIDAEKGALALDGNLSGDGQVLVGQGSTLEFGGSVADDLTAMFLPSGDGTSADATIASRVIHDVRGFR